MYKLTQVMHRNWKEMPECLIIKNLLRCSWWYSLLRKGTADLSCESVVLVFPSNIPSKIFEYYLLALSHGVQRRWCYCYVWWTSWNMSSRGMGVSAPYTCDARRSNADTICFTTSSKNTWAKCECSKERNSKEIEKSTVQVRGYPGRPGLKRHSVSKWLKSLPSEQAALTKWGRTEVTREV